MSATKQLNRVRAEIDRVDRQLVRLLSRRTRLALRTRWLKRVQGKPIFDRRRETQVLRQVSRTNNGPLSRASLSTIYRQILKASRTLSTRGK